MWRNEVIMAKSGMACCENCSGGFRCYNGNCPSCGGYCGEYPGTGPWSSKDKEKEEMKKK